MSLPGSQRAVSTNGNDFQHQERIASHSRLSTETKTRFKYLIYTHFVLALIVFAQVVTYRLPLRTQWGVPRPHLWQYIWLISVFASVCGLFSLNRNQIFLMKLFFRGTVIFGLGTILTTIILNLSELFTFKKLKTNHQLDEIEPQTLFGLPLLVLWYIFLLIAVQIHAYSLYMANILLNNWQPVKSSKVH